MNCAALRSIILNEGLITIGYGAFNSCKALTEIDIPDSVTLLNSSGTYPTFGDCTGLTIVKIGDGLGEIKPYTFYRCSALVSVSIGSNVNTIANNAFSNCSKIESIIVPESINIIGNNAFSSCTALKSAYFYGNAPTSFGTNVFSGANSAFVIYYIPGKNGWTTPKWNGYDTAPFTPDPLILYPITVANMQNGSVTASKTTAVEGERITLSVSPGEGFRLIDGSLKANGVVVLAYKFTMPAEAVEITAEFEQITVEPKTYTVLVSAGAGGTASGSGTYVENSNVTVIATANTNYTFDGWYESGAKVPSAGATYSFQATANRALQARFTYTASGMAKINLPAVTGKPGQTVTVMIELEENPGLAGLQLEIGYDANVLKLESLGSVTHGFALKSLVFVGLNDVTIKNNPFKVSWAGATNDSSKGTILNIEFMILETAENGVYPITVSYVPANTFDELGLPVAASVTNGNVTVKNIIYGDVNGDGVITNVDAMLIMQYINGWAVDTDNSAADVDGDGFVTINDAILIMQYVNGWFDKFLVERD
jgi:hypothetical protein